MGKWSINGPENPQRPRNWSIFCLSWPTKRKIATETIVQHFGFPATTAKRYLRQLVEFGYLEPQGGNKNRTYLVVAYNIMIRMAFFP